MRLWLVRHARPQLPEGVCYGRSDVAAHPLATRACAASLREVLPAGTAVWSSPAARCRDLAHALAALRPDLQLECDPRLQELDFGTWELRHWDAIGEAALCAWTSDFAAHRPGGGETVTELISRVGAAWSDARTLQRDVAWITHAGVIRAVHLLRSGRDALEDASQWPALEVPFGSVTEVALDGA